MRNNLFLLGLSTVVIVIAWRSQIVSSAIVTSPAKLSSVKNIDQLNASETWKLIEDVMDDYVELSDAFYAPAANETVREKRTIAVFRNIWNRTRTGFQQVRTLFSGSGSSGSGSGGFRTFFSNLLNRVLLFLTTLWDRITGFFMRIGGGGGSSGGGGGLFSRLAAGVTGLFSRFSGGGSGGSGGLGGLFGTTTTTESFYYPESDYVYTTASTTTSSTTESYSNDVLGDSGDSNLKLDDAVGKSSSDSNDKSNGKVSGGYSDDFIPFPGDSENTPEFRSSRSMPSSIISGIIPTKSESRYYPHVVRSPGVLHLTDDGRYIVV